MGIFNFIFGNLRNSKKVIQSVKTLLKDYDEEPNQKVQKPESFQFYLDSFEPGKSYDLKQKIEDKGFRMVTAPQSVLFLEYLSDKNPSDRNFLLKKLIYNNIPQNLLGTDTAVFRKGKSFFVQDYSKRNSSGESKMDDNLEILYKTTEYGNSRIEDNGVVYSKNKNIRRTDHKFKTMELKNKELPYNSGLFTIFGNNSSKLIHLINGSRTIFRIGLPIEGAKFVNYSIPLEYRGNPTFLLNAQQPENTSNVWTFGIKKKENPEDETLILGENFEKNFLKPASVIEYYDDLSNQAIEIWKKSGNKIAKKDTELGIQRKYLIEEMKKVEKFTKEFYNTDLLVDELTQIRYNKEKEQIPEKSLEKIVLKEIAMTEKKAI
ncbi:MAG: hypothetical protein WC812_01170 [Candidatus Pacearchaeota archaeon]|jgi:hypothetical protein